MSLQNSFENRVRINISVMEIDLMQNINKFSVMNDTKTFNDNRIQDKNSRIILAQLIYLLNQGESFSELEQKLLFFRVTKLLLSNNPGLKRLIYKFLKMIGVQKYAHIIIQSLINDLINPNPLIRIEALRLIPVIQEEIQMQKIERFVLKAFLDDNVQVFNTALIVGINSYKKFPNIVNKWSKEIQLKLNQKNHINYHALILLHEINKSNPKLFIDSLRAVEQPQEKIVNLQILKFIKEYSNKCNLEKTIQIVMKNQEELNISLEPIIKRLQNMLNPQTDIIEIYSALKQIDNLINNYGKSNPEITKLIYFLEIFQEDLNIMQITSSMHILTTKYLFNLTQLNESKYNFLEGLNELIEIHPQYGQLALNTLQLIIYQDSNIVLKIMTIQIIYLILTYSKQYSLTSLQILFRLSSPTEFKIQLFIIQTICWNFFWIVIKELEQANIFLCFTYLKQQFENCFEDFINFSSQRYQLIKKQLLNLIQADQMKTKLTQGQFQDKVILRDLNTYYERYDFEAQGVCGDQTTILKQQDVFLSNNGNDFN